MEAANTKSFFWETFPPMPTCRVYCSPTYQDGHLFVVGGCSQQGQPLDTLEMLDVVSHKWMALPSMATPRAGAAAVMLGKEVLVIGGVDSTQRPLATVEVYHTDEGRWEKKEDLAQPSMGISVLEKDGVIYALGGMGADTSPQALLQMYEPAKDHWQPLPSMPTPCYGASTFLHGNKIYVMGGRQGKLPITAFEAFDLEVRSWTRYPSVPSRRAFASCAMAEGCFFSLGGLQQPGPHNFYSRPHFVNTVEMFDLEEGSWSRLSRAIRMRDKRANFVAGHLGGRVIVAGGLGKDQSGGTDYFILPSSMASSILFRVEGNQSSALGSAEGFNLAKKKWEPLPSMPTGRCSCATLEAPNLLFVIGGVAQGPSSAVEALSLQEEV